MISCQSKEKSVSNNQETIKTQSDVTEKRIPIWKIGQDSILEKNNPQNLDLTKHQLFIDTTRNSDFYKAYFDWKPNFSDKGGTEYYLKEISKKYKPKKISLGNFPKTWISLKRLNNEFVIYDKCDGISPRYFIDKSSVNFYAIESDSDMIYKLINISKDEIEIELRTIPLKSKTEKAIFSIGKTEYKNVFLLKYIYDDREYKELVTPLERVSEFDLVVNNCVRTKRMEFQGFDKINYDEY
ncbi:hypothetical protein Fleli_2353 [Bernardetia litoralis DSM 6794]|uniref:Uncharacterized protein n=1 Tax=Bernardetia litoralis (strain ATCC 23117 / DSM 6794 / NBRC 15988 / NCIMB 1366 / Fx l1 / Sio-4) TaxID=880071 RepID=I4AL90_BERLS|nr:hypothetical protein [Bernardetia litoralis]AFM04725.1 hypothetical protein Fleli_2353 [Bernardetia litoralis DSM 6794]